MDALVTKTQDRQAKISHLRVDLQQEKDQHRESIARSTITALKGLMYPIMSVGANRLSQVLFADQSKQVQDQEKDELLSENDQMVKQLASTETEMSSLQAELGELNSALAMSKVKHLLNSNKRYMLVSLSCLLVLQEESTNLEYT